MKKAFTRLLSISIIMALCVLLGGNGGAALSVKADENPKTSPATVYEANKDFNTTVAELSVWLLRESHKEKTGNTLISPVSVMTALAMAGNGARGETQSEFDGLFGQSFEKYSAQRAVSKLMSKFTNTSRVKIKSANSVWIKADFKVLPAYVKSCKSYFKAEVFNEPFDSTTVEKVNSWVGKKTGGDINNMLNEMPDNSKMLLINAISFDGKWANGYKEDDIYSDIFFCLDGTESEAKFMRSEESVYLEDGKCTGFLKRYDNKYAFAAILPYEDINQYIDSLTGEELLSLMENAKQNKITAVIPKFSLDYGIELTKPLQAVGLNNAFTYSADFSGMTGNQDLYIGSVLHKAFINVNEKGTKAKAATAVEMRAKSEGSCVCLNRPFIFAIIDTRTSLPIFLGMVERL